MTEPLQQETGVPSCQALDVAVDVDLSECTEPSYFDSDKPRVLAEYTSPTNQKTSLALPWNTGDFLEVRDDLNQVFHVATANGGLSYFSVVTEAGVEVLYNATIPEDQVREQLFFGYIRSLSRLFPELFPGSTCTVKAYLSHNWAQTNLTVT